MCVGLVLEVTKPQIEYEFYFLFFRIIIFNIITKVNNYEH